MVNGEINLACQSSHALPAAQHRTNPVESALQHSHGTADGNKDGSGHGCQQGHGQHLDAGADTVEHACQDACANADAQSDDCVHRKGLLCLGTVLIGVHKMLHLAKTAQQALATLMVILRIGDAVQAGGLTHGVQLTQAGITLLILAPQGHGHLQAEGGAARHTQLLQAQNAVHAAGDKGDKKQRIEGEAAAEQVHSAL